ncbi:MAG: FKBP-type peptidyl-prolyl cis-trans isomerase [Treponemataceae bacterium]|nr:FKBP-type peptidyl-prolyl cis-trans isomerase [Treponemataceae bacterium]
MNGKVFDYSRDGSTLDFTTNGGQMITGFDLMVQEMKVGETRICILPPQYAYGNQSVGGVIPANSWLVFQITLQQAK